MALIYYIQRTDPSGNIEFLSSDGFSWLAGADGAFSTASEDIANAISATLNNLLLSITGFFTAPPTSPFIASVLAEDIYHASAVNFDGSTMLINAALSALDGKSGTASIWFKAAGTAVGQTPMFWIVNPGGGSPLAFSWLTHHSTGAVGLGAINGQFSGGSNKDIDTHSMFFDENTWVHVLVSADTSGVTSKIAGYVNDFDLGNPPASSHGSNFDITFNGLPLYVGSGDFLNSDYTGDMAELQIWPGVSICESDSTITEANRRLFISAAGKPVNPAFATSALGQPAVLLSGDAANFATNQGYGGEFVTTGFLTDAGSSPSD